MRIPTKEEVMKRKKELEEKGFACKANSRRHGGPEMRKRKLELSVSSVK
jgi:hypothetical protein